MKGGGRHCEGDLAEATVRAGRGPEAQSQRARAGLESLIGTLALALALALALMPRRRLQGGPCSEDAALTVRVRVRDRNRDRERSGVRARIL